MTRRRRFAPRAWAMLDEAGLLDKLRKLEALHAGTTSEGEKVAAAFAAERIHCVPADPPPGSVRVEFESHDPDLVAHDGETCRLPCGLWAPPGRATFVRRDLQGEYLDEFSARVPEGDARFRLRRFDPGMQGGGGLLVGLGVAGAIGGSALLVWALSPCDHQGATIGFDTLLFVGSAAAVVGGAFLLRASNGHVERTLPLVLAVAPTHGGASAAVAFRFQDGSTCRSGTKRTRDRASEPIAPSCLTRSCAGASRESRRLKSSRAKAILCERFARDPLSEAP